MRKLGMLVALAVVVLTATPAAQTTGQAGQSFAFDYLDADYTSAAVTRFEMQLDAGAWASVGVPTDTVAVAGGKTYRVPIPALTPGSHTVAFRACNADGCGAAGAALAFRFVVLPNPPSNVRIVGG